MLIAAADWCMMTITHLAETFWVKFVRKSSLRKIPITEFFNPTSTGIQNIISNIKWGSINGHCHIILRISSAYNTWLANKEQPMISHCYQNHLPRIELATFAFCDQNEIYCDLMCPFLMSVNIQLASSLTAHSHQAF